MASRRTAEDWIREGRVRVNGQVSSLGDRADPEKDSIKVDEKRVRPSSGPHTYILLNKPKGFVTTVSDPEGRDTVLHLIPGRLRRGVKPVGRLDVQTEGLLLLTDDGDLSEALLHPRTALLRRYRIWVRPVPDPKLLRRLLEGGVVEGVRVRPKRVVHEGAARGLGVLLIDLGEGKKREVRVLAKAVGLEVVRLVRVEFGPIRLGTLGVGRTRPLTRAETDALRRDAFSERGPGARLR